MMDRLGFENNSPWPVEGTVPSSALRE